MKPTSALFRVRRLAPPSLPTLLLLACLAGSSVAAEAKTDKPATHKAAKGALQTEVTLDAVFESMKMEPLQLEPKVWTDLTVVDVVAHGSKVKKGDVLLRLEMDKLEEQITELAEGEKTGKLSLEQAEAELENLEKTTPLSLEAAQRSKYRAVEDYDYFVSTSRELSEKSTRFGLKSAEQRLANAREELEQLEKMYRADDLTEETEEIILERQKFAVEAAEFSLENSRHSTKRNLEVSIPRSHEDLKAQKINQTLAFGLSEISLPIARQQKELALAKMKRDRTKAAEKLEDLKRDKDWATLRAPMDGLVYYGACDDGKWTTGAAVAKKLVPGGKVTAKEVLMTVVHPARLQLRAVISEKDLSKIREGAKGEAVPVSAPGSKLPVTLESIALVPEPGGGFPATLSVEVPKNSRLVPGMNTKLEFKGESESLGVLVPKKAVVKEGDESFVYVVIEQGDPEKRSVKTGESDKKVIDITEGLKAGEVILMEKPE